MNASEQIDDLIAKLTDWRGTTFARVRKIIHEADPEIEEEWKWRGTPVWSHSGQVCLANAWKDKVSLTFPEGASLPDPDKLFNAGLGGNKWRTIDIHMDDKIKDGPLKKLVRSAVSQNLEKAKSARGIHKHRTHTL